VSGPPHTGISRRTAAALALVVLVIAVAAGMSLVHLPYAIYRPGPATNTLGAIDGKQIITVKGTKTYPTSGALDFTTVTLYGGPNYPVNVWDWLSAKVDSSSEIVPVDKVFSPDVSGKQIQKRNTAEMQGSQDEAKVVALRAIGKKVPEDVVIAQVMDDSPSAAVLREGDIIRKVDGTRVEDLAGVQRLVEKQKPGSTVPMALERDGKDITVQARTAKVDGRTVVGVYLAPRFHFPVDVNIYAGHVGGPSAGMMFSLGIYDTLTPGKLTGGVKFAGTGTLDSEGNVGPIGGIRQKLVGARDVGA
jgi:PDZ domain-containing protein